MGVYLGAGKTVYDYSAMQGPAPSGYHVPLNTERQNIYNIRTALGGGSRDGVNFGIALKLPFVGCRGKSSADVKVQGSAGYYRSSKQSDNNYAYSLYFYSANISPQNVTNLSDGASVRCFKDDPVIPTSSWTKLYGTSIEVGGIFWSSADGLISLSSDGQTWITIQDKNLGATTVWNSGDTLSEANCGGYFQWGNNYMFPFTGTVTTSSTKVDTNNYGPGNYYSSSTFITVSSTPYNWSSVQNNNLWGAATGIIPKTVYPELKNAYIGSTPVKRATMRVNGVEKQVRPKKGLPTEYQEIEYIQSSGTQYFVVGTSFKTSYKSVIDFQMTQTGGDYVPLGVTDSSRGRYGIDFWNGLKVINGGSDWTSTISEDTNRHTVTINKSTATVDGTNYTTGYVDKTVSGGIGVFCYNEYTYSSPYNYKSSAKLYKLDIYNENGVHIYDLVPCYRKSDNVIGMYDLVNDQFYTNSGTGTFTKGPDV